MVGTGARKSHAVRLRPDRTTTTASSPDSDPGRHACTAADDSTGTSVAENDDFGAGLASHLEWTCPATGTYTLGKSLRRVVFKNTHLHCAPCM